MKLNEEIRTRRRAKDMTQEDLASALSVSISAVSQWESGKTMPDLAMIPALCSVLDVSADVLLGIDLANKEKEIEEILEETLRYGARGRMAEAIEILEAGLKRHPDTPSLLEKLMHCYLNRGYAQDMAEDFDKAAEIGEKLLTMKLDAQMQIHVLQALCYYYAERNPERARELLEQIPHMWVTQEEVAVSISEGEERIERTRELIIRYADNLSYKLAFLPFYLGNATEEEKIALYGKAMTILRTIYDEGDFGFYHTRMRDYEQWTARAYARLGKADETLAHLEKAATYAIALVRYVEEEDSLHTYTSLAVRGYESGGFSTNAKENSAQQMLDEIGSGQYDFVRATPDFAAIRAKLEKVAGDWSVRDTGSDAI